MKLLGLIGGVSPESTEMYLRLLNADARQRLGGEHSANLMVYALDYGVMIQHYHQEDWDAFSDEVVKGAKRLQAAGVDGVIICSNTTHVAAPHVIKATGLPLIHLQDALTTEMNARGVERPFLMGTPAVMGGRHYLGELGKRYDGDVVVPAGEEQKVIGRIILDELVNGEVKGSSRAELIEIVGSYKDCDGVILGCTELCMILSQGLFDLPVFDTTAIHAAAASAYAFGDG